MKKVLKKGLVIGSIYLILLLCTFMMSERIERLEDNERVGNGSVSVLTLDEGSNS